MKRAALLVWAAGLVILFVTSIAWFVLGDLSRGLVTAAEFVVWLATPIAAALGVVVFQSVLTEERRAADLPAFTDKQLDKMIDEAAIDE